MVILALDVSGAATGWALGRRREVRGLWKVYWENNR